LWLPRFLMRNNLNLEKYNMHRAHHYIASLFLSAAIAAPGAIMAIPVPQQVGVQVRVYDKSHKDYHNWDDNENRAWGRAKTTGILTNTPKLLRGSSHNTGSGATPIQISTNKLATLCEENQGLIPPVAVRTGGSVSRRSLPRAIERASDSTNGTPYFSSLNNLAPLV
jgi:hypothetical protein